MIYEDRQQRFKAALDAAAKPRIRHYTRWNALQLANRHVADANAFARLFGDAVPFPMTEAEALSHALAWERKE